VRNYAHLELEPAAGLNLIVGGNAQGKSNLLEAIALLGTGKSFRTNRDADVIRRDFDLATLSGEAGVRAGRVRLSCTIASTPRGTRKLYAVNGRHVRYANFLGSLRVVTFVPSDLHLVTGPPAARRSFLNGALSQDQKLYYHELVRYQKALSQKAALLKTEAGPDPELLGVYNETLVEAGSVMMLARAQFAVALNEAAARAHAAWTGGAESLAVRYEPNVPFDVPTADAVAGAFAQRLRAMDTQERARAAALVGPHRDDLSLLLNDAPLASYGSQGQQRTAVLALKVAEYTTMHDRSGEAPLLLLDDVLSELDPARAAAFLGGVGSFEQAFITATHLPAQFPAARRYEVVAAALRESP